MNQAYLILEYYHLLVNLIINDPIHGHIKLHDLSIKIIDTPEFQRLRDIKQLGMAYLLYPGANHTRFEHSIGTAYLAKRFAYHLKESQPELGITDEDCLCIEVAGLCHDLGHGPFSHLFDKVFIRQVNPSSTWLHEKGSIEMLDYLIQTNHLIPYFKQANLDEADILFIQELVYGPLNPSPNLAGTDATTKQEWIYKGRPEDKSFLYEIISHKNCGIDVDKWDYFARDSYYCGINRSFDCQRYIYCTRVIKSETNGLPTIAVRDKEAISAYDIFRTRDSLYRRCYFHKTVVVLTLMMSDVLMEADYFIKIYGENMQSYSISQCIHSMSAYSRLSDSIIGVIEYLRTPELKTAQDILQRIKKRHFYAFIGQIHFPRPQQEFNLEKVRKELSESACEETKCASPSSQGQDLQKTPPLHPETISATVLAYDYGMEECNPIEKLSFYTKEHQDKAIKISKREISSMLPEVFTENHVIIFCKSEEPGVISLAEKAFTRWCRNNNYTQSRVK